MHLMTICVLREKQRKEKSTFYGRKWNYTESCSDRMNYTDSCTDKMELH